MSEQHHTAEDLLPRHIRRYASLIAVVGAAVALVGYLMGVVEPGVPQRPPAVSRSVNHQAPPAVKYSELASAHIQPNAHWTNDLSQLIFNSPGIFEPVVRTNEMKLAAVADRASNRAYDGAPPTVPHPIDTRAASACLACHGEGIKIADRVGSRMSHAHLTNCTQCHVEQSPLTDTDMNSFRGVYRAGPGPRANPGAPPGVPHTTFMRENCASCHGLVTRPGIRTTHPWLTNCLQCHSPSATLDQSPVRE